MNTSILREACVESFEETLKAVQNGADRIELCADLEVGGTTPAFDLIERVLHTFDLPLKVMIRPRGGDFVYSKVEFEQMKVSIERCRALGVEEIVCGVLKPDQTLDLERLEELAVFSAPMRICIHKAIDRCPDPIREIAGLKAIPGVVSILSSGKATTAQEGIPMLQAMLQACRPELQLIVAGKVTEQNLMQLHSEIGAAEYHGRRIVSYK